METVTPQKIEITLINGERETIETDKSSFVENAVKEYCDTKLITRDCVDFYSMIKDYDVTLWRWPSKDRERNAVGISVFYFNITAENEYEALLKAKAQFDHAVYDSYVT